MAEVNSDVVEPRGRQRKYRVYSQSLDIRRYKYHKGWMVLLSVRTLEDVPGKNT